MKFSIIIPVYNVAPFLRATLDSVLSQSFSDYECICVDDGSTDGSAEILDSYAKEDVRFRVIHQLNKGVGQARNSALEIAQGEWICYLDADDLYAPRMLEVGDYLVSRSEAPEIAYVKRRNFIDEKSVRFSQLACKNIPYEFIDTHHVFCKTVLGISSCCAFYKRKIFGDLRFSQLSIGEDRIYSVECFVRCNRIVLGDVVCYFYRKRLGSAMNAPISKQKLVDSIFYIKRYFEIVGASGKALPQGFKRELTSLLLENCSHQIRAGNLPDKPILWKFWYETIVHLAHIGGLTSWGRFVAVLIRILPQGLVAMGLCEIPYHLKKKGVHR